MSKGRITQRKLKGISLYMDDLLQQAREAFATFMFAFYFVGVTLTLLWGIVKIVIPVIGIIWQILVMIFLFIQSALQ